MLLYIQLDKSQFPRFGWVGRKNECGAAAAPAVGAAGADQPDQAKLPISTDPALRRAQGQRRLPGDARNRCMLFEM
jgi:hypothetical protein